MWGQLIFRFEFELAPSWQLTRRKLKRGEAKFQRKLVCNRSRRGRKKPFFSLSLPERAGGVSPNPKFPFQKKTEIFCKRGGGHLFQRGVIIK